MVFDWDGPERRTAQIIVVEPESGERGDVAKLMRYFPCPQDRNEHTDHDSVKLIKKRGGSCRCIPCMHTSQSVGMGRIRGPGSRPEHRIPLTGYPN